MEQQRKPAHEITPKTKDQDAGVMRPRTPATGMIAQASADERKSASFGRQVSTGGFNFAAMDPWEVYGKCESLSYSMDTVGLNGVNFVYWAIRDLIFRKEYELAQNAISIFETKFNEVDPTIVPELTPKAVPPPSVMASISKWLGLDGAETSEAE